MDDCDSLKISALRFMKKNNFFKKFQIIAVEHSLNCRTASTPLSPLILDLEIDLILLFAFSNSLYEKVVEYPAAGRRIFQEATSDHLRDYLIDRQCQPISCVQLMLRCKLSSVIAEGKSLYAKTHGCLSYFQRYVLTSVSITRSDKCNLSTICALTRCPDFNCPGHSGKYTSMEELSHGVKLDNCKHCAKKCYEDAAGRGIVQKVLAKFTTVMAFNCRDKKSFHAALTCSITDPLVDKLELGDMYDIWGRYDVSVYELWGLKRTSFFPATEIITLSSLPPTIQSLWTSFGETGPNDPWCFARTLCLELGSRIYRKNAAMSLKMGLLLSLASLGNDRCASILCVGPSIDLVEEDVIRYAANCADRNIPVNFPVHANIATNGQQTWLHSGSLLKAKTGVYDVGDWESLKTAQKNDLMQALDSGHIVTGEKNAKSIGNDKMEFLSSQLPLKTAVWTYWKCEKNYGQSQPAVLQNLVNLFGIPFLASVEESVTAESIHERLELICNGGKNNPRKVPIDELIEYLRIVNGLSITLSEEAIKLIKDYFVASRGVRKGCFPSQSITFMTTLAEAHARLSLRTEVTYDDVVAIIYLYEESMCFLYGYSVFTLPPFMKQEISNIGERMESFKTWLKLYLASIVR